MNNNNNNEKKQEGTTRMAIRAISGPVGDDTYAVLPGGVGQVADLGDEMMRDEDYDPECDDGIGTVDDEEWGIAEPIPDIKVTKVQSKVALLLIEDGTLLRHMERFTMINSCLDYPITPSLWQDLYSDFGVYPEYLRPYKHTQLRSAANQIVSAMRVYYTADGLDKGMKDEGWFRRTDFGLELKKEAPRTLFSKIGRKVGLRLQFYLASVREKSLRNVHITPEGKIVSGTESMILLKHHNGRGKGSLPIFTQIDQDCYEDWKARKRNDWTLGGAFYAAGRGLVMKVGQQQDWFFRGIAQTLAPVDKSTGEEGAILTPANSNLRFWALLVATRNPPFQPFALSKPQVIVALCPLVQYMRSELTGFFEHSLYFEGTQVTHAIVLANFLNLIEADVVVGDLPHALIPRLLRTTMLVTSNDCGSGDPYLNNGVMRRAVAEVFLNPPDQAIVYAPQSNDLSVCVEARGIILSLDSPAKLSELAEKWVLSQANGTNFALHLLLGPQPMVCITKGGPFRIRTTPFVLDAVVSLSSAAYPLTMRNYQASVNWTHGMVDRPLAILQALGGGSPPVRWVETTVAQLDFFRFVQDTASKADKRAAAVRARPSAFTFDDTEERV